MFPHGTLTNRLLAPACALAFLLLAFAPAADAATGCSQKRIDPVRGMWFDCEEWGYVYCPLMPLAQAGEPTNLYGHRVGVYVYTCEEGYEYGYDAETTVIVEGEDSAPVCQHVPYVGVGGTQVPGTGETHCTEDVRGTRSVDTSVPRLIPAAGLVVIYPCPNPALECQGWEAGYMYTSFWTVSATCWNSGGGMSNGLTEYGAYTRVDDVWIYQLQCDAPRWS